MNIILKIPDMSCFHCEMVIQDELHKLTDNLQIQIDLDAKIVRIEGDVQPEEVINQIKKAGYTPQTIE